MVADLDALETQLRDEAHVIDLREDGWTIRHTLFCRRIGLFDCPITQAAETDLKDRPPQAPGRYIVDLDGGGYLAIGERATDHEEQLDVVALVAELRAARTFRDQVAAALAPGRMRGFDGPDGVSKDEVIADVAAALERYEPGIAP
jgi:hypothetical protein